MLRGGLRRGISVLWSLGLMLTGSAVLGLAIAGIMAPLESAGLGLGAGGMMEGRSASISSRGWIQLDDRAASGGEESIAEKSLRSGEGQEQWEPRGWARICRTWCVVGGDVCLDACEVIRGPETPEREAALRDAHHL
ncbi:hypothetical protein RZS28_18600 (plasmid) [Methylocapsa polymorpha]|uniref:Uncharacterized protein n=1 Tax=Methylocapsa polymorpha TaxID=3080828 RepID=A0ABZ0HYU4_9HYPH|nr:hypothetical protein [Methylocapsa sp. RX1]WOJ91739.1 hypothetical protein RZS28_18600 [Methylocapsa sp. RX1]